MSNDAFLRLSFTYGFCTDHVIDAATISPLCEAT